MTNLPLVYGLAFAGPALLAFTLTPWAVRLAERLGVMDRPAPHKRHLRATPYLGGLPVAIALVAAGVAVGGPSRELLVILGCALAVAVVGLVDDVHTVGPLVKLAVEGLAGAVLWTAGVRAGFFGVAAADLVLTILWVIGITNALNLLDNMDGLASGVTAIASLAYFALAAQQGFFLVAAFALALAGASLGFLRYNFPPARIFLGDAGSLFLGFLLAALALKLDLVGASGIVRAAVAALILGVPVFDTLLVVVARLRGGRPVYVGGTDHFSHRLAGLGLSDRNIALLTYGAQAVCAGLAVLAERAAQGLLVGAASLGVVAAVVGLVLFLRVPAPASRVEIPESPLVDLTPPAGADTRRGSS